MSIVGLFLMPSSRQTLVEYTVSLFCAPPPTFVIASVLIKTLCQPRPSFLLGAAFLFSHQSEESACLASPISYSRGAEHVHLLYIELDTIWNTLIRKCRSSATVNARTANCVAAINLFARHLLAFNFDKKFTFETCL